MSFPLRRQAPGSVVRPQRRARPSWRAVAIAVLAILAAYVTGFVRTAASRDATLPRRAFTTEYRDGTYSAWGRARHGRVSVTVTIRRGRIVSAAIADCRMKYPCSMIATAPPQVVARQGASVDVVSGATHSTEAFTRAVDAALAQAARP